MSIADLIGAIASVVSFVVMWPQALRIWAARSNPVLLVGVSAGTQVLVLVNAALWGVYAWMTGAFWVGAPGLVNAPLALACLVLIHRARRTDPAHRCGYLGSEPHDFVVTAPPGYGHVHSPCAGVRVQGFAVPLGTGIAESARLRGLGLGDDDLLANSVGI